MVQEEAILVGDVNMAVAAVDHWYVLVVSC